MTQAELDELVEFVDDINSDVANLINTKQDNITDIADIREGAEKGATSVQPSDIEDVARKGSGYVIANGILDENDDYWHLPNNSLNDKEHTLASKSDIEEKILVIGDSSDEAKANFIAVANGEKTADIYIGSVDVQGYIIEGCVKLEQSGSSSNPMYSFAIIGSPAIGRYDGNLIKVRCEVANDVISSEVEVIDAYSKPSTGIPKTDLASDVQTTLDNANNAVLRDKFGDMEAIQIQGFEGSLNGYLYALPNEATGDEDDILLSRNTVKTINGESIFGSGDINIEGGGGTITEIKANGTSIATSGVANIPAASTSVYGVTKLSNATNSTSTTLAATASAVKAAYDLANSFVPMTLNTSRTSFGTSFNWSPNQKYASTAVLGNNVTFNIDVSSIDVTKDNTWTLSFILGSTARTISFAVSQTGYTII